MHEIGKWVSFLENLDKKIKLEFFAMHLGITNGLTQSTIYQTVLITANSIKQRGIPLLMNKEEHKSLTPY